MLDRVYKIAQTGQIEEPNAVDNIMAQYQPKQEGGFWNGLKNFAGSNLGRMTLGGLTGAAIGGLTGRNVNEALLGGIAGATGAAKGITSRNQYLNNLAEKRQERADRMAEAEKTRQLQIDLANKRIEANKAAADLAFERRLQEIEANQAFQRELAKENRQYALEDRANSQDFTREGWKYQAGREDARYDRQLKDQIDKEEREENRYLNRLNDTRDYEAGLLEAKTKREDELWERNQQAALDKEERDARRYDARLEDTRNYEKQVLEDERDHKQKLLDEQRKYDANLLKEQRAYNSGLLDEERVYNREVARQKQADAIELAIAKENAKRQQYQPGTVINGVTLTGNKTYDTEALKQKAKNESEREKAELNREVAQRRNAEMMPRVMQSIDRAYKALEDGTGLGQFGGWAFTTDKGGQNRADIKNAQAQINTAMRGLLSELGVGATEMNSAAEANAYRYVLAPDMSEGEIKRVLDNFVADYTSGDLKQSLASWVGENGNSDSDLSSISTDDLMGML